MLLEGSGRDTKMLSLNPACKVLHDKSYLGILKALKPRIRACSPTSSDLVPTLGLAVRERSNSVGSLVNKEPTWTDPAFFTLHEGNFSSEGIILVTIKRSHSADSPLTFEVIEEPKVEQVCVLLDLGDNTDAA